MKARIYRFRALSRTNSFDVQRHHADLLAVTSDLGGPLSSGLYRKGDTGFRNQSQNYIRLDERDSYPVEVAARQRK